MKKITLILMTMASSFAFVNCSSEDEGNIFDCAPHIEKVTEAAQKYNNDSTEENCLAYKAALQAAIDDKCSTTTFQIILDNLTCE